MTVRRSRTWHPVGVQVWTALEQVPGDVGPTVVTVGNFDGVHRGHAAVLRRVVEVARRRGARPVAITFEPHPLHVLRPDIAPPLVTGQGQRLDLLAGTGLHGVLVQHFDRSLAAQSPQEWVAGTVVGALRASVVVIGEDVRFGHRNSGDLATLRQLGREHGFDVLALPDVAGPHGRRWSSSWVRACLLDGDVSQAAELLGRPHRLDGVVVHGDHRGRELGYPTANLSSDAEGLVPADGVYAGWLSVDPGDTDVEVDEDGTPERERLAAAVSIGTNPQFDGTARRVEAYVLDQDPESFDLYGRTVRLEVVERLRGTERFDSVADLVEQMGRDVSRTRQVLDAEPAVGTTAD